MGATFVNLRRGFLTPLINRHNFMHDQQEKGSFFLCLSFVPYDIMGAAPARIWPPTSL